MSTLVQVGEKLIDFDIFTMIPPDEGSIDQVYGRIGTGKTTYGTRRIIKELKRGVVVYANWRIDWNGFDERSSKWCLFLGLIGFKKVFYYFPKENFHFWDIAHDKIDGLACLPFIEQLAKLTDCNIHLDEGHVPFDSYEATHMDMNKRTAVLSTRHFNRSLVIYSQRPTAIHVTLRANVNRFFKCEKSISFRLGKRRFIRFKVTEFQDMTSSGTVDEERIKDDEGNETKEYKHMISQYIYWGTNKLFKMYDSKYLRGTIPYSKDNLAVPYYLNYGRRLKEFIWRS